MDIKKFSAGPIIGYDINLQKNIIIPIPIKNIIKFDEFINQYNNGSIKKEKNKYEIYLSNDNIQIINENIDIFKDKEKINDDITVGYGIYKDMNGNNLKKIKIILDNTYIFCNKIDTDGLTSLKLFFRKIIIYLINGKYYINLLLYKVKKNFTNVQHLTIDLDFVYIPYSKCNEISKLKKQYKDYVMSFNDKIKAKNISIVI